MQCSKMTSNNSNPATTIDSLDLRQMKVMLLALFADVEHRDGVAELLPHVGQFAAAKPDGNGMSVMDVLKLQKAARSARLVAESSPDSKRKRQYSQLPSFFREKSCTRTVKATWLFPQTSSTNPVKS
jgi:hypothetical protein